MDNNLIPILFMFACTITLVQIRCDDNGVHSEYLQFIISNDTRLSEDGRLPFIGLAYKYGYPAEQRTVITRDGYKLSLYHIKGDSRRIVFLVHGNTVSASSWITRGETSLAITLAKLGYDVWAVNLRGTTPSRQHVSINADRDQERFYNFSFYEHGIYDVPDTIDYILKDTGQSKLLCIGHSIGTTAFYVMGAEKPEYNDKVKAVISLAPQCFIKGIRGISQIFFLIGKKIIRLLKMFGVAEVISKKQIASVFRMLCLKPHACNDSMRRFFFQIFGPDEKGFEEEFIPTMVGHYPDGSSRKMFDHLYQMHESGKFAKFDYGSKGNMAMYNSIKPPAMDLGKVTMKVALLVGKNDYLSSIGSSELLRRALPNVVYYQVLPYEQFSHGSFLWAKHMPKTLYPYLLRLVEKYS